MDEKKKRILLCNCAKTMLVDGGAIGDALGCGAIPVHSQLCRSEVETFRAALSDDDVLVACTQEAPLFHELAEDAGGEAALRFTNIRERAGWAEGGPATAKMAALLADAIQPVRPALLKTIESDGLCIVYGTGQAALDAARMLSRRLSVTLVLTGAEDLLLPTVLDFAIYRGQLREVSGSLGSFDVVLDGYAPIMPSSRAEAEFLMPRDGARSRCSIIVDLSGEPAKVTGWRRRDGYLKADPGDAAAVARALFDASDLVGTFEKPIYVTYDSSICVHGRSKITGCSNCLDACPAGAITSLGDTIAVDNGICGGCGACASHCPTGAVSYAYPDRSDLIARVQTLLRVYGETGGRKPVLLFHEEREGTEILGAMSRYGRGLPQNVLPIGLHAAGMPGHEVFAAALAAGASAAIVLGNPLNAEDYSAVALEVDLTNTIAAAFGDTAGARVQILMERDPDKVEAALWDLQPAEPIMAQRFEPVGGKRDIARTALGLLRGAFDAAPEVIALPATAPYGRIAIDTAGCTLCLACVSACPVGAIGDNPDRPEVRFTEAACVQCGLCAKTCPENVITLVPQLNFAPSAMQPETLNTEEPFACIRCGKPFGVKSSIERIAAQLAGHSMFQTSARADLIKMCDDCRIRTQAEMADNPLAMGAPRRPRTTQDYLDAREKGLSVEDFLSED
ncbi:MAG: 4Fe-4S binding protein [Propylenella sp.]